jgi:uncharacterized DUF497 family protein
MQITYDPKKSERNGELRGLPFVTVEDFDWSCTLIVEDLRHDYGERRFQALGFISERLHMLIFAYRGPAVHIISLRKANRREIKRYEQTNRS